MPGADVLGRARTVLEVVALVRRECFGRERFRPRRGLSLSSIVVHSMNTADLIWNRAAMESGGEHPRAGDRALSALLRMHNLIMNGGVHHAVEVLSPAEFAAAIDGYAYFGCHAAADWLGDFTKEAVASEWAGETERADDLRYEELVPGDQHLFNRMERAWRASPEEFAATS